VGIIHDAHAHMSSSWNAEQLEYIHAPLGHGALIGIPGGGKTRSIIGRVCRLVDNGVIPHDGFIILTFSRLAAQDFVSKGTAQRSDLFSNANVRTLHSLAGHIMSRCTPLGKTGCMIQTVIARTTALIESGTDLQPVDLLANVKVIIIDEAQDLSEIQLNFVLALSRRLGAAVEMVGDPNQSVFGFQGGDPMLLCNHPGWRVHLRKNYRSTRSIIDVVNASRPWKTDVDMEPAVQRSSIEEQRPRLFCGNELEVLRRLVSDLTDLKAADGLKSCAIIAPTKRSYRRNKLCNLGLQWAANMLYNEGIPFKIHYDETKEGSEHRKKGQASLSSGRVHLLTIHGSKGLEFDSVFLLNFHHDTYGFQASEDDMRVYRYMWYVGLSRARKQLMCYSLSWRQVWEFDEPISESFDLLGEPPLQVSAHKSPKQVMKSFLAWTDLLNDRIKLPEQKLCTLEDNLIGGVTFDVSSPLLNPPFPKLPEWGHISSLYGNWAEAWFEYCYRKSEPLCFQRIKGMASDPIILSGRHAATVNIVRRHLNKSYSDPWTLTELRNVSGLEEYAERIASVIEYLTTKITSDSVVFHVHTGNKCQWFDTLKLRSMLDEWQSRIQALTLTDLWKMVFFLWQYDCEACYRWTADMPKTHLVAKALRRHAHHIEQWAASLGDGWVFQVKCDWSDLAVTGVIDAINPEQRQILELKFSPSSFQPMHALQIAGYAHMCGARDHSLIVWNLYDGNRHMVNTSFEQGSVTSIFDVIKQATDTI